MLMLEMATQAGGQLGCVEQALPVQEQMWRSFKTQHFS